MSRNPGVDAEKPNGIPVDSPGCQEDEPLEVHTRTFGKMLLEIPKIQ